MFLTDIAVVLAVILFFGAVGIELRRDRNKRMWVGGRAKTRERSLVETSEEFPKPESKSKSA